MIKYPYLPENKQILYVPLDNKWMQEAQKIANELSGCSWWPTGAVVVKDEKIIGRASNEGKWQPLCPRVQNNCPTGEGYHFCKEICQQNGHSELGAVNNAIANNNDPGQADLYLFGHWWCCKKCWDSIIKHGIKNVYLLENAENIFCREPRLALQKELEKKTKNNERVTPEDTIWKI